MDVSIESQSSEGSPIKKVIKPKKRSLVERELETNLTSKITSPVNNNGSPNTTSRYGRARKSTIDPENISTSLNNSLNIKSPSPVKKIVKKSETPIKVIESPVKKYVCKDLIQTPNKSPRTNSHVNSILERSSEKYSLKISENNYPSTSSVVKEINFGSKKRKRKANKIIEEPELNELEKACIYQIGEVAWARMGSYPFWPCLICRDPFSDVFVKMQAKGKVERQYIHVLFFGDGQRGWIQGNHLQKYCGLQAFLDAQKQLSPEVKKKDPKLYAAYFVSEKQQTKWIKSVDEAELLLTKPQVLRLEIYNDILIAKQSAKTTPKQNKEKAARISRKSSDVSLSESLYDSLFSEEDTKKVDEEESSKRKLKKANFDVSKVVTACLDDMAAKTGMSKIQKESHMDRWLQKAKSKTPEKVQLKKKSKSNLLDITETKETKNSENLSKKKLQKNINIITDKKNNKTPSKNSESNFKPYIKNGFGIGYITKVESLMDDEHKSIFEKIEQNVLIDGNVYLVNDDVCDEVVVAEVDGEPLDNENSEIILNGRSTPPECMIMNHNKSNINMDYLKSDENDLPLDEQENININSNINISKHINVNIHTDDTDKQDNCKSINTNECSNNLFEKSATSHIKINKDLKDKIDSKDHKCLSITDENTVIRVESSSISSCLESNKIMCDNNKYEPQNIDCVQEDSVENLLDDLIVDDNIKDLKPEYDNRDFVNYVQRKKDTIMDENPDLSHREILEYLYNTWLYDYSKSGKNVEGKKVHNTRKRNDLNNKSAENIFRESEKKLTIKSPANRSSDKGSKKNDKIKITNEETNPCDENEKKTIMEKKNDLKNLGSILLIEDNEHINKLTVNEKMKKLRNINIEEIKKMDNINYTCKKEQENSINLMNAKQLCNKIDAKTMSMDILSNNQLSKTANVKDKTLEPIISDKNNMKTTDGIDSDKEIFINSVIVNDVTNGNKTTENMLPNTEVKTSEVSYSNNENISMDCVNIKKSSELNLILEINKEVDKLEFNENKNDPEFLKYIELQQDLVINENPGISENDGLLYLYKSWRYQQNENNIDRNNESINDEIGQKNYSSSITNQDKICDLSSDVSTIYGDDISDRCSIYDKDSIGLSCFGKSISLDSNNSKFKECDISIDTVPLTTVLNGDIKCNGVSIFDKINTYSNDPEFLEYVERRQDTIFEEHPDFSEKDILSYLFKTWRYEQDNIRDKNIDYLKETTVKGFYKQQNPKKNIKYKSNDKNQIKENFIESHDKNNDDILSETNLTPKQSKDIQVSIVEVKSKNDLEDNMVTNKTQNMVNGIEDSISMDVVMQSSDSKLICSNSNLESFNIRCIPEASIKEIPVNIERSRNDDNTGKLKQCYNNPHFIQYVELKQDVIIDENPDLSEEAILEYLYDTWKYEEEHKSVEMKNTDLKQNNLVNGLEKLDHKSSKLTIYDNKVEKEQIISNNCLVKKVTVKPPIDVGIEGIAEEKIQIKNKSNTPLNVGIAEEKKQIKNKTDPPLNVGIVEEKKQVKNKPATSLAVGITKEKKQVKNKTDTKLLVSIKKSSITSSKTTLDTWLINSGKKTVSESLNTMPISNKLNDLSQTKEVNSIEIKISEKTNSKKKTKAEVKTYDIENVDKNIEKPDLIDFDNDIPKHVITTDKSLSKYQDADFLKYLELRQDVVIDDYPDLSMDDIIAHLYKTWSYEERLKSDVRKNDDIQQSELVKAEEDVSVPVTKRVYKKKAKVEKFTNNDEMEFQKDKPSRKQALKSYYNESEDFSESDDEFLDLTKKQLEDTITGEGVQIQGQVFNEVEYFLHQMTLPKPNVFKGLIREKVCEICERPDNLVKCRGCSEMFHVDCVAKPENIVEDPALIKVRKKKKPRGRKPKNDSGDDVSFDDNERSSEELDSIDLAINVDEFEAQVETKMKELLKLADNFDYSQYSSDDDIDWSKTIPGKCEIIDVKLKKSVKLNSENFKCKNCQKFDMPLCFVCKEIISPKNNIEFRQKCNVAHCTKYYHLECLEHWPQTQFGTKEFSKNGKKCETITCPRHVCHTCVCDDPRGCKTRFNAEKLAKCVRCPAVYHSFTKCLPAGTQILSASHVICPRHYELKPGKVPCHVNTGWCFICALGGTLICCEYCPTSFHAECLNIKPPEGSYMCEDCETGRLPLYGEMVWVKLGHYRWWPGLILHPSEIPDNVMAIKHYFGEFVVRFFGQYDHYWVNRGRVFPFQEGDTGKISSTRSKIDAAFTRAIEDAYKACEVMKTANPNAEESLDIASSLIAPHYVKLKVNKPYGSLVSWRPDDSEANSMTQCECDPNEEDPCGPHSQCLNRILATECGPTCRAGDRCFNRNFEKRNYPKMTPYRTSHRGWGLKTLVDIKKGQFVIEYVGELIDDEEIQKRMKRKHEIRDENYYFLTLDKDRTIDAGPKGNFSRFMNHSCEPNCETQKWTVLGDVRVGLFAIQDIPANSEITFNYHFECAGMEKKQCMCGAKMCAGFMGAKVKQMEYQSKRPKTTEKTNKKVQKKSKKLSADSPSTPKPKGRPRNPVKPRELTEIEKDLLIIKTALSDTENDKNSVKNIENDTTSVKNNENDKTSVKMVEDDKSNVKNPEDDKSTVKNTEDDKSTDKIIVNAKKNLETVEMTNILKRKRSCEERLNEEIPTGKKCKVDIDPIDENTLKNLLNGI